MSENLLVTIYIPTFNRVDLLERAINSVVTQSYKNIEIIVVDDCSTDGTQEFLKEIAKGDERIKFFLKEKNGGACESRNIAIQNARGEYITGLDDDDYFLPNRIENFVSNLSNVKNSVLLFDNPIIKLDDRPIITKKRKIMNTLKPKKIRAKDLIFSNYIGNQVFIKTDILKKFGGFDKNMPMWQDIECWYNILVNTGGYGLSLNSYTYVVDLSHEMDRISNFKIEKGKKAFRCFSKKHSLSQQDSQLLFCQLYGYDKKLIKLGPLFEKLRRRFDLLIFLNTLKNLYLFFKR
ncbi:glycosyltransferase family 2 protein [Acinetobacter terrestris]|uniref:Glycosyltransferase n=1 Tax=Acinetobacter terrestris TaxID=2529843 RepID=A0ABX1UW82_9GAMM|nr:glycosyltransferase family 2 protein [Acinetobacter terrestris]NNH27468.1 glycosyltransferase [Acinetobacter terrestris]